jgi:hypothetical protein
MFSSKPTIVIVLRLKSIEFYNGRESEKEILQFPPKVMKKDEIVDWEKFELFIEEFIARNSLKKQHAIMVLGKDILFEKTIPRGDKEKEEAEQAKFFKSIPFDEKDVVTKRLMDDENIYLVSTHKDFYQSVKYTLEKFGWTIDQVVPMTMFDDFDADKTLDFAEVNQILNHTDLLRIGDMMASEDTVKPTRGQKIEEQRQSGGIFSKSNILLLLIIALLCGVVVFGGLYFTNAKVPTNLFSFSPTPTPSPLPTSTPTPVPSFDKSAASVKVLNGTGTPGQAGKVKSMISDLGFNQIDTDNAETKTTTTLVVFSPNVPSDVQDSIVKALEKTFSKVTPSTDKTATTDVIVTTGEEK